ECLSEMLERGVLERPGSRRGARDRHVSIGQPFQAEIMRTSSCREGFSSAAPTRKHEPRYLAGTAIFRDTDPVPMRVEHDIRIVENDTVPGSRPAPRGRSATCTIACWSLPCP